MLPLYRSFIQVCDQDFNFWAGRCPNSKISHRRHKRYSIAMSCACSYKNWIEWLGAYGQIAHCVHWYLSSFPFGSALSFWITVQILTRIILWRIDTATFHKYSNRTLERDLLSRVTVSQSERKTIFFSQGFFLFEQHRIDKNMKWSQRSNKKN